MTADEPIVSFGLFGTLVDAPRPSDPAAAIATELAARDVPVPDDWTEAYGETHIDAPDGAECSLPAHVHAALRSRDVDVREHGDGNGNVVRRAVTAAFDPEVTTRPGAVEAVDAARSHGRVAVLSNCGVPGLARRVLIRSALDRLAFDVVETSLTCGWQKPDRRAFEAVVGRLDGSIEEMIHVGDDPETDGGADDAGATAVLLSETPLRELPAYLDAH